MPPVVSLAGLRLPLSLPKSILRVELIAALVVPVLSLAILGIPTPEAIGAARIVVLAAALPITLDLDDPL